MSTPSSVPTSPPAVLGAARANGQRPPLAGYLLAALGAALFSTKAIIIKLAYDEGIRAETLLALRMSLSLPFYLAIGAAALGRNARSGNALPSPRLLVSAACVGLLGYWFASYTDFLGLIYISAQFERLILFTYPAFVVILGALFFGQSLHPRAFIGIGVSYAGLALIFATKLTALGSDVARGAALVLAASVAFALYQLLAKPLIGRLGPQLFTCVAMGAAAVPALLQFLLLEPISTLLVSPTMLGYGLALAIGATVLPSFLLNAALHRISAQANATIGTLSPVVTILLAVALLGEEVSWIDAAGTVLVIAGVGLFTLFDQRGRS